MSTYTTIDDLKKRLDEEVLAGLADDANTPPDLADATTIATLDQAIADFSQMIRVDSTNAKAYFTVLFSIFFPSKGG